jgi:hypothetical protein
MVKKRKPFAQRGHDPHQMWGRHYYLISIEMLASKYRIITRGITKHGLP